eukprot:scaffold2204_cov166-Amphora_coffeaeformis.AAC.4
MMTEPCGRMRQASDDDKKGCKYSYRYECSRLVDYSSLEGRIELTVTSSPRVWYGTVGGMKGNGRNKPHKDLDNNVWAISAVVMLCWRPSPASPYFLEGPTH